MSIDFYPAKLVDKTWESVVPMQGDSERLIAAARNNEDFEFSAFEPNPDYMPFSTLNMSYGNAMFILRLIGLSPDDSEACGNLPIDDVFEAAHGFLFYNGRVRDIDQYVAERVFALREMARLGRSRGATHIVWA